MRKFSLVLCLSAVLIAGPASALFSLLGIKNSMVEFLLDQLSTEGVFEITVEEVDEPDDGTTAIKGLKITDRDGVWFTAESLNFSWNPSRLLRGEVEFSNLAMAGVTVLRQPIMPPAEAPAADPATPEEDQGAFAWPRSPLTLRIDRLALERVELAQAVLGQAIAFNAEGAARDEGDVQSARLDLTRTDTIAGTISFDYARTFSSNTLAVNLAAAEGPGGLVAALAGLPSDASSKITVKADGPPTDWRLALDVDLADTLAADGTARISYEGPIRVDAAFSARPGVKMAPDIANLLGERASLIAKASEGPDGTILIEDGRLNAPDLDLIASGTYSRTTGAADLAVDLAARSGLARPFEGVDFAGASFKGTVKGVPGAISADGDLGLTGLRTAPVDVATAELVVAFRQSGPETNPTMSLEVTGGTTGLRLDAIAPEVIGPADLQIVTALTGDEVYLETAWLDSHLLKISVSGEANIASRDLDIGFGVSTPRMGQVAAAYGVDADGAVALTGEARQTDGVLTLTTTSDLTGLTHPLAAAASLHTDSTVIHDGTVTRFDVLSTGTRLRIDQIGPDLLGQVETHTKGQLAGDLLTLEQARLTSALLDVGASGTYTLSDSSAQLDYRIAAPRLGDVAGRYDAPLSGALQARGMAAVPPRGTGAPKLEGTLTVNALSWAGTRYGDLRLDHTVEASATPGGTLDLSLANGAYAPAQVRTGFRFDQPTLRLSGLDASVLGARARGDLAIDTKGPSASGALSLKAASLRPLSRVAGTPLSGSLDGTLTLTAPGGRQDAVITLDARDLNAAGSTVGRADIRAALRNLLGTPSVKITAKTNAIRTGDVALEIADLSADGPLSRLNLTARILGEMQEKPLSAALAARANLTGGAIRATVNRLDAALGEDAVALRSPLALTSRGSVITAKGIDLALPDEGSLTGDITRSGQALTGDITLSAPKLGFLKRLAAVPVRSGGLEASARFDTRRATALATITGRGLVFEDVDGTGALDIDADLDWKGRSADAKATISGNFGAPLRASARVPIRVSGGLPGLAKRGPVEAKIDWSGEIGALWALVPAAGHILSGKTIIDLAVSGDISAPDLAGGVRIENGGYQNLDFGTILTDLSVETSLLAGGDLGLKVTASDGAKGTVSVDGRIALDASGIDLKTALRKAVLVRRDDINARIGGDISIAGPMTALAVNGKITVQEAEIRLVNNNPPSVVTLGDVLIKGQPEPKVRDKDSSVTLTLDIDAPGRMFVRGRGLDSEWKMGLAVRGDAASPRVTGRIERVRGRLDLIGKGFDLKRGRIDFDGGAKIDPSIDVVLERDANDLVGRIVVDGFASDPKLGFTSTPALPSDEILPRVLFGKSSQALTGSQAIQLGLGLATLMDGGGGTLDKVRGAVGLDSLRVEEDGEGNASVAVGKEVAEGVWVGTKQSLGEGGTSVVVEIDVFDDIQIEGAASETEGSSVGLKWKKDF